MVVERRGCLYPTIPSSNNIISSFFSLLEWNRPGFKKRSGMSQTWHNHEASRLMLACLWNTAIMKILLLCFSINFKLTVHLRQLLPLISPFKIKDVRIQKVMYLLFNYSKHHQSYAVTEWHILSNSQTVLQRRWHNRQQQKHPEICCSDTGIQQCKEEKERSGSPGHGKELKCKLKSTVRAKRDSTAEEGDNQMVLSPWALTLCGRSSCNLQTQATTGNVKGLLRESHRWNAVVDSNGWWVIWGSDVH